MLNLQFVNSVGDDSTTIIVKALETDRKTNLW